MHKLNFNTYINTLSNLNFHYLVNQENLKIMEKISEMERREKEKTEKIDQSSDFRIANESTFEEKNKQSLLEDNPAFENTMNMNNKTMQSKFKYSEYGKEHSSILNITEVVEENGGMREKYEKIGLLKEKLRRLKKENNFLSTKMSQINTDIFILTKLFTEGSHEISKELLKIHEIQLDKIVTSN